MVESPYLHVLQLIVIKDLVIASLLQLVILVYLKLFLREGEWPHVRICGATKGSRGEKKVTGKS